MRAKNRRRLQGKSPVGGPDRLPPRATHGTVFGIAQRREGRWRPRFRFQATDDGLPKGRKERFLVNSTGLALIKQAAIGLDKTASEVTEEAANDWRELQRAGDRER